MKCPTCAHTSRRPRYLSGAGRERNPTSSPGPREGQARSVQVFLSGCSFRPAAAGHRPQGPYCPAQHSTAASVDRGSGKKRPGLRVRRPIRGDKHLRWRRRQSPALKGLESTSRHVYLSVFPPPISSSGLSQPF